MMTKWQRILWAACTALVVGTFSMGCELIASVDRDQIPGPEASTAAAGAGGAAGAGTGGTAGAGGSSTSDAARDTGAPEPGAEASTDTGPSDAPVVVDARSDQRADQQVGGDSGSPDAPTESTTADTDSADAGFADAGSTDEADVTSTDDAGD